MLSASRRTGATHCPDNFKDMDYLLPTVSSDFTGFIPRPGQADRTLRWLKDALRRHGSLDPSMFRHLSWHSFRVFIPDGAYQLGMPRDQRQYLGNWTTENMADNIYKREKRKVVQRAWPEVADKLGNLDLTGGKTVPTDLDHQHWQPEILDLEATPPQEEPEEPRSPQPKLRRKNQKPGSPGSTRLTTPKPSEDMNSQGDSLRAVSASRANFLHGAYEHQSPDSGWPGGGLRLATISLEGIGSQSRGLSAGAASLCQML